MADSLTFNPFLELAKKIRKERRRRLLTPQRTPAVEGIGHNNRKECLNGASPMTQDPDTVLFLKEMDGVVPLAPKGGSGERESWGSMGEARGEGGDTGAGDARCRKVSARQRAEEQEALRLLQELVQGKREIPIAYTSEFVSGGRSPFSSMVSEKLHRGRFSVQAYLDLHGMDVVTALERCEEFVEEAMRKGLRCIAFIHGRGLGSKREPVLKKAVLDWLRRGRYRRYLAAFSSAPIWDGGTGVTYVLLKRSPYRR